MVDSQHTSPHLRHVFTAADRVKAASHHAHKHAHAMVDEHYSTPEGEPSAVELGGEVDPQVVDHPSGF